MEKELEKCEKLPCPEVDDYDMGTPGVLLNHEIRHYAERHEMIVPFNPDQLKPAGYKLTLGEDYAIGGELKKLHPEPGKNELVIPPFEVAIISTRETINLPRFIIARWNLRVSLVYKGLLWTGALQVDPGWCGPLHCPIYNLSNENITLKLGEEIVLMDFVKTTPFKKGMSIEYTRPPKRKNLGDYNWKLKSALFTEAGLRIRKIENDIEQISRKIDTRVNRVESLMGVIFTSIAILFAGLSILITSRNLLKPESLPISFFIWTGVSISISIIAIALALFLRKRSEFEKRWHRIVVNIFYIACAIIFLVLIVAIIAKIICWSEVVQCLKLGIIEWLR